MTNEKTECPGCQEEAILHNTISNRYPATLHYRHDTPHSALNAKTGTIRLANCPTCGLVFNSSFDLSLVSYSSEYDNRQSFSGSFKKHLEDITQQIRRFVPKTNARILEVGCGKGEFLTQLCENIGATGVGYDTSYEATVSLKSDHVEFHRSYVHAGDIRTKFDLVICRHVVEHIDQISEFIKELSQIAKAADNAYLLIETPDFEWILQNSAFWDIFYEHCNYFTPSALSNICLKNDLETVSHTKVFGDQYQLLILRPNTAPTNEMTEVRKNESLGDFLKLFEDQLESISDSINYASNSSWALWGSGAKGVTLASLLNQNRPECLIDINPAKQGCYAPVSGIPVMAPEDAMKLNPGTIMIANPNYESEIRELLKSLEYTGNIQILK